MAGAQAKTQASALITPSAATTALLTDDTSPPAQTIKLIFIHRSTGENWLADGNGGLGIAIIRAIVAGERDPEKLAAFQDRNCKKSAEEIGRALTGTWRAEHLFILKQSLEMYDFYTKQVKACDAEIDRMYALTRPEDARMSF